MITARLVDDKIVFTDQETGFPNPQGWWTKFPRTALYIAANCDENCACPSVGGAEQPGTDEEMAESEEQLGHYYNLLIYDMGYYGLVHCEALENVKFMPHEIVNRMY